MKPVHKSSVRMLFVFCNVYCCIFGNACFECVFDRKLAFGFELWCNGEHLAMWKAVGSLFWSFRFPHANSEKCLLIIEFTYCRSLKAGKKDLLEFASVLSESCSIEKAMPSICSWDCWLPLLQCWHLYFLEKDGCTQAFMLIA